MLALRRSLTRWLNPGPSAEAIRYHWWVLGTGMGEISRVLASYGFRLVDLPELNLQRKRAMRVLEVWDTQRYRAWLQTGQVPLIIAPFTHCLSVSLADHVEADAIADPLELRPAVQNISMEGPHVLV